VADRVIKLNYGLIESDNSILHLNGFASTVPFRGSAA
jgi:hypothetical protein